MNVSQVSDQPVLAYSGGVESKEERAPFPAATEKASAVAQPPSGFLVNHSRKAAALCHPLEFDGEVTDELLKLIGEIALVSEEKITKLWGFIMRSKVPETYTAKIGRIASRAITALNLAKFSFSGKDLSSVNIPGANLSRGIFYKTNFIGANLHGVQLQQVNLGNTLLQKANLRGANFGQFSLKAPNSTCRNTCSLTVQGPLVAIGESLDSLVGKSAAIHIWSLFEGRQEHVCSWTQKFGITSLALTIDCTRLVSTESNGDVTVWNPNNGVLMYKLPLSDKAAGVGHYVVSLSHDKPMIACTHTTGAIHLFDLSTEQLTDSISGEGAIGKALFMPDGIGLLIPTREGIKLFDTRLKRTTKMLTAPSPWDRQYDRMIFSADGKLIAAAGVMGVVIWSIEYAVPIKLLGNSLMPEHKRDPNGITPLAGGVEAVAFSNNGRLLAICAGKEIQIWSTTNWEQLDRWGGESLINNAMGLQFTSNDQHVVAIFSDNEPMLWEVSSTLSSPLMTHLDDVQSLCVTSHGQTVFSMSSNTLRKWSVKTGDCIGHEDEIEQFAVSKDERYLLTLQNNCVVLRELATKSNIKRFARVSSICGVYFLSTGKAMVVGKEMVEIYDIPTDKIFSILEGETASMTVHALSDNGQWFACGTQEGDLLAWDSINEKVRILRKEHASTVTNIKFSRDTIISKSDSGVHIWMPLKDSQRIVKDCTDAFVVTIDGCDWFILNQAGILKVYTEKGQEKRLILEHKLRVDCKAPFSPSGSPEENMIHMSDDYGRDKQWAPATETMYVSDSKYSPAISTITLHPSLPILAVGGNNGMIQLWNFVSGHLHNVLWGHVAAITCLTFSDDGRNLFSGSKDRSLQRWNLSAGIEDARLACRSAPHSLVLHGVNTADAALDERVTTLLFDAGARMQEGMPFGSLLRNRETYVQRPYIFCVEEDLSFAEIEVKSHNLDESIVRIHHRILKKEDDREFVQQLVLCMKDLYALTPLSFHFILNAIERVAQLVQAKKSIDSDFLVELQRVFEMRVSREPIFVRDFLDAKLQAIIERLMKMIKP